MTKASWAPSTRSRPRPSSPPTSSASAWEPTRHAGRGPLASESGFKSALFISGLDVGAAAANVLWDNVVNGMPLPAHDHRQHDDGDPRQLQGRDGSGVAHQLRRHSVVPGADRVPGQRGRARGSSPPPNATIPRTSMSTLEGQDHGPARPCRAGAGGAFDSRGHRRRSPTSRPSRTSRSRCAPARSSRSWARTAPASPRCSRSSTATTSPTRAP